MRFNRIAMLGLGAAVLAQPAMAQDAADDTGAYAAVALSYAMMPDTDNVVYNAPTPGSTIRVVNLMDDRVGYAGALGYDFGPVRLEAQVGHTDFRGGKSIGADQFDGVVLVQDLKQDETRTMLNAYADFGKGRVHPYLGGGLGAVWLHNVTFGPRIVFPNEAKRELINDRDTRFAWQAMGGLGIDLTSRLGASLGYRYLEAGTTEGVDSRGERFTRPHRNHNIDLGLRFRF